MGIAELQTDLLANPDDEGAFDDPRRHEVPVAYSMRSMAEDPVHSALQPFQDFVCYWTAFNNIYVTVADKRGQRASLRRFEDGTLRTRLVAHVHIPQVASVRERDQIDLAFHELGADLKQKLVDMLVLVSLHIVRHVGGGAK